MDLNLFDLDDDDMLNSAYLESIQQLSESVKVPEFVCTGEDGVKSEFSSGGFIKNGFIRNYDRMNFGIQELLLTEYNFEMSDVHIRSKVKFSFELACSNMQHLNASVIGPLCSSQKITCHQRRQQITQLLYLLLNTTHNEQWQMIQPLLTNWRRLLYRITEADILRCVYFANSPKGNECKMPGYHLLHGILEWRLLDLCILKRYTNIESTQKRNDENVLIVQLERIFDDLLTCSLFLFKKKRSVNLLLISPFPCTCFKEFWLILQLLLAKWSSSIGDSPILELTFWKLFNSSIARMKCQMEKFSCTTLIFAEFSNWVINALVQLFGYSLNGNFEGVTCARATAEKVESHDFLQYHVMEFLNANPTEEQLRVFICLLTPTLVQWWRPEINIPMQLWEFYHKHVNSPFYIIGSAPSNLEVLCCNGKAYVEKFRYLLDSQYEIDARLSSYTIFILLLGKTLNCFLKENLIHQAQKLLGRIYSKFSLQKFLSLNETGIHNIIELFIVLALTGNFNDLGPKLWDKLLSIDLKKISANKRITVTKGHTAMLILFAQNHVDFSEYVKKLLHQLSSIDQDLAVSRVVADSLIYIFEASDDFHLGEHLLINSWILNFLNNCTSGEQGRCLESFHLIFIKLNSCASLIKTNLNLITVLNTYILPFLKQHYRLSFNCLIPQLAADFCIYAKTTENFQKLFSFFIETPTVNHEATLQFLLRVIESNKRSLVDPRVIIHVWLKSLVQLSALNNVYKLTEVVVQLPIFTLMTNLNANDIINVKDQLCGFVSAVGRNYVTCTDYEKRCNIADNLNLSLRNFEKWIQHDIKLDKIDLTFRFYSFIAIVVYNCPQIVYSKSKISCFFHIAITRFILPTSILMGKPPEGNLAQLIHKIWPILIQGIGHLNFKSDPYIAKTLNDLIQKWTPHFKISQNFKIVARPFIMCLFGDNVELSLFIFEKLTNMFLVIQRRKAEPNACLVITIFQEVVDSIVSKATDEVAVRHLETFMKSTSLVMLEHIMMIDDMVPSRAMLLNLFKRLTDNPIYKQSVILEELLAENLRILTKKHLAYLTFFYFDLLMKLAQITPDLIKRNMDFLISEVNIVEQKRGVGEDNHIRECLQKLQQSLMRIKFIS